MRRKKIKAIPQPEISQQEESELIESLPPSLESFFDAAAASGQQIRIMLYRIMQPRTGRPKRFFLEEYQSDPPSLKEIGEIHGGGEYEIIAVGEADPTSGKGKFLKTAQFNIDPRYDAIKQARETPQRLPAQAQQDTQNQFAQGLSMIAELVKAISPLISSQQQAQNPAQMLGAMAEIGNTMLTNSFKTQMESQKEIMQTLRENMPTISGDEDPEDKSFERIIKALEMFMPLFIKTPEPFRAPMVAQAKNMPDVKSILKSKLRKEALRKKLILKFGEEKAKEIFEVFDNHRGEKKAVAA